MKVRNPRRLHLSAIWLVMALATFVFSSCAPQKEPIEFGKDSCVFCHMGIADKRYGAELVTKKGRVYKFDSIECMISYPEKSNLSPEDIHSQWVIDFSQPGKLIDLTKSQFLHNPQMPSPMGLNVSSFQNKSDLEKVRSQFGGQVILYPQVEKLSKAWLESRNSAVSKAKEKSNSTVTEKSCCSKKEEKCCSSPEKKQEKKKEKPCCSQKNPPSPEKKAEVSEATPAG